jgi:hypothetical protein
LLGHKTEVGLDLRVAEFEQAASLVGAAMAVIPFDISAAVAVNPEKLNADRNGDEARGQASTPAKTQSIIGKGEEHAENRHGFAEKARAVAPAPAPVVPAGIENNRRRGRQNPGREKCPRRPRLDGSP